jgi:hypothetical protein
LVPLCQLRLLAGQEHGRTIPLVDTRVMAAPTLTQVKDKSIKRASRLS